MQESRQISLQAGKDPFKGEKGQIQIRRNRASKQVTAATFPAALGAIGKSKRRGFYARKHSAQESFQKMYAGVLASYNRIAHAPKIDFSKDEPEQLADMIANVKKLVPHGVDVIIQEDHCDNWVITVLREVNWDYGQASFPVGKILKALRREDDFLHNVFLDFIKTLSCFAGIDLWYHGLFGEEIERMDERLLNLQEEEDYDSKTIKALYGAIQYYGNGLPHYYEQELKFMGPVSDIEWFIGAVEQYKRHPVAQIIREGVEVLRHHKRVYDYQMYHKDKDNEYFLPLDMGFCIAWSLTDVLASEVEATLESYAQGGVEEPIQFISIREGVEIKDFDQFKNEDTFIIDMQRYFDRTFSTINNIKKYA